MFSFQQTVGLGMATGVPGEKVVDSPFRCQEFTIVSALASYNIVGATAYSKTAEFRAAAGNTGGVLPFAGILVDPKNHALYGDANGTLDASLTLPNNTQAALATMGTIYVTLPAAAALGDHVIFDNTTGAISTITPGTALPTGKSWAFATVDYFVPTAAGLAAITLTPQTTLP